MGGRLSEGGTSDMRYDRRADIYPWTQLLERRAQGWKIRENRDDDGDGTIVTAASHRSLGVQPSANRHRVLIFLTPSLRISMCEVCRLTDDCADIMVSSYWLMKAEPDSRMVKGVDVKVSRSLVH
jgi:hypothetical protein